MKKITVFKKSAIAENIATGIKGAIIMIDFQSENTIHYLIQPKGLDSKGEPFKPIWTLSNLVKCKETEELDVPVEILRTKVKDKITGFSGLATSITYHISGCIHVTITAKSSDNSLSAYECSITRCEGPAIKKMTEKEIKKERAERPSPAGSSFRFEK